MNAIETINLRKEYRGAVAVADLNLTVAEGELFSLLGINGAGKTTTIKMLSCLIRPTSGSASILGHDISKEPQIVKSLISTSPQETAVAPNLTVRENLQLIAGIYSLPNPKAAAQEILEEFRLEQIAGKQAKKLSGGWQRRLSIAMALISQPKVLFLDEPTLGLDVLARRELWQTIQALKGNITIILTTHYLEEAQALSDRVGILSGGRLSAVGTAEALIAQAGGGSFEDAFIRLAGGAST